MAIATKKEKWSFYWIELIMFTRNGDYHTFCPFKTTSKEQAKIEGEDMALAICALEEDWTIAEFVKVYTCAQMAANVERTRNDHEPF